MIAPCPYFDTKCSKSSLSGAGRRHKGEWKESISASKPMERVGLAKARLPHMEATSDKAVHAAYLARRADGGGVGCACLREMGV